MKSARLKFRIFPLAALLAVSIAASPAGLLGEGLPKVLHAEEVGLSSERLERIGALMKQHVEEKKIAGAVTLVARRGKVAHLGVYGMQDAEAGEPMQADTIFRIASMTKPITSMAVMMLYEEGRFLLSDPVSKFIPEFKDMTVLPPESSAGQTPVAADRAVTIRHLLTHTSGLTYQWNKRLGHKYKEAGITHGLLQDPSTLAVKMRTLAKVPLLHHPGDAFEYGLSIDVLGRIVEVASGMTLDEFFQQRIFQPLGMKDTHFFLPKGKKARLAAVYGRDETGPIERVGELPVKGEEALVYSVSYPYEGSRSYFSGGGGLVSTVADYARFSQAMLNGGGLDGVRLLSPKTVELMTTNHLANLKNGSGLGKVGFQDANRGFGLGFSVVRDERDLTEIGSIGTFGWGGFFFTQFFIDPEEEMLGVFMAQLHPSGGLKLQGRFRALAYQAIVE